MSPVSTDYQKVAECRAMDEPHSDAWRNPSIPTQQLALTDAELKRWHKGEPIAPFDALQKCMKFVGPGTVLEVGCGVGHNADVLQWGLEWFDDYTYTGVDYSEEFIRVAKERRGWFDFRVMDALLLEYQDKQFDCVISGCVILHICNWRRALAETARVARKFVVLHRTPITQDATQYYFKKAYGVQVVELKFNEAELLAEMARHGFSERARFSVAANNITYLMERTT